MNIAHHRLHNQRIASDLFEEPADVVKWLGAVQAQDYPAAKWAVGLRIQEATDAEIEQAFNDGAILRTHVLRPTWHFVAPADIRWMLALTAPRVNVAMGYGDRQLELDDAALARSNAVLAKGLEGGNQLTRLELASLLEREGISLGSARRLTHIMIHAELDAIVCSGPMRGKQFTYALLDERAPETKTLEREEALAELAMRYFTSHGPASLQDFVWWSGLTTADAKAGLEMVRPVLAYEVVDGKTYWLSADTSATPSKYVSETAYLLSNFDEYTVGYRDRSAVFDLSYVGILGGRGDLLSNHTIVIDGQVVGTWKRTVKKGTVAVEVKPFAPLDDAGNRTLAGAIERYSRFIGLPLP